MLTAKLKHIDLKEIVARIEPSAQRVSARGKQYVRTEPGRADMATAAAIFALADIWSGGRRQVRMAEVERHREVQAYDEATIRLAASLKRLARLKQVKIDFDRDGVLIDPGSAWIEN